MSETKLPTRLERKTLYQGKRFNFYADKVVMPNGHQIDPFYFLDFEFSTVAVIVEDSENQILLERVARYPTQSVTWELPIGIIEDNESMLETAQREVQEETGYTTIEHQHVHTHHPMSGLSNMIVHTIRCRADRQIGEINKNEVESIRWFSQQEISALISNGEITDGFTLMGLLLHLHS